MSAKKREVTWFKAVNNLNEIYQSIDMKFSFVSEIEGDLRQCHEWVKCRDFLHDAVRTTITGEASSIYGFKFDLENNTPIDIEKMAILVAYKDAKFWTGTRTQLSRGLKLINQIEKNVGEELSTINKVEGNAAGGYKHVWMFVGPRMWITCPQLVSLYTFLIRLGAQKFKIGATLPDTINNIEKYIKTAKSCNDVKYLKTTLKYIVGIVKERNSFAFYKKNGVSALYDRGTGINSFHNRGGIVNLCSCTTPFGDVNSAVEKLKKEIDE